MRASLAHTRGFTLIEMSIVLVVIGLIVGGILVGQDLIRAAGVRATIAQIEKYNTAANTFRGKYGYLPGDIKDPDASMFGFQARGQYAGEGDGDGLLEGISDNGPNDTDCEGVFSGEQAMFWVDLSKAGLIDGTFNTATPIVIPNGGTITGAAIGNYFPQAKTGHGGYVYVWSGGWPFLQSFVCARGDGLNYFSVDGIRSNNGEESNSVAALTVSEAYAIDKKIDDGLPQSGSTTAIDADWWTSGGGFPLGDNDSSTGGPVVAGDGVATTPSSTTCYDNGGVAGATEQYSMGTNGGSGINCSLSFRFQ